MMEAYNRQGNSQVFQDFRSVLYLRPCQDLPLLQADQLAQGCQVHQSHLGYQDNQGIQVDQGDPVSKRVIIKSM